MHMGTPACTSWPCEVCCQPPGHYHCGQGECHCKQAPQQHRAGSNRQACLQPMHHSLPVANGDSPVSAGQLPQGGPAVPGGLGSGAGRPRAGIPAAHRAPRAQLVHGPGQPRALLRLRGLWLPASSQLGPDFGIKRPPTQPAHLCPSLGRPHPPPACFAACSWRSNFSDPQGQRPGNADPGVLQRVPLGRTQCQGLKT